MTQIDFYRALKEYCADKVKNSGYTGCENCCLRLYCYTPPCERTDAMMEQVIQYLANERNNKNSQGDSTHYICLQQPCPCTMDMSSALGFDDLP